MGDADGQVKRVQFWFDADGDGVLGTGDRQVGTDEHADASGNWLRRLSVDYAYGAPGVARFFAVAFDELGFKGAAVSVEMELL